MDIGVTGNYVEAGDYLVASVLKDSSYYSDYYSSFDKQTLTLAAGENGTLTLTGFSIMSWGEIIPEAISGAAVGYYTADGTYTALNLTTGADGFYFL